MSYEQSRCKAGVAGATQGFPHVILNSHRDFPGVLPPELEGVCVNTQQGWELGAIQQFLRLNMEPPCHVEPGDFRDLSGINSSPIYLAYVRPAPLG